MVNFCLFVDCDPVTFEEAAKDEGRIKAMDAEMSSIEKNDTWELIPLPVGKKTNGVKWVYKMKYKPDGQVDLMKARLVVKGYRKKPGVDYFEVFAPVARMYSHHEGRVGKGRGREIGRGMVVGGGGGMRMVVGGGGMVVVGKGGGVGVRLGMGARSGGRGLSSGTGRRRRRRTTSSEEGCFLFFLIYAGRWSRVSLCSCYEI